MASWTRRGTVVVVPFYSCLGMIDPIRLGVRSGHFALCAEGSPLVGLYETLKCHTYIRWSGNDGGAGVSQGFDLGFGAPAVSSDDRAGVAHPLS